MNLERILLFLAGAALIAASFLPFFVIDINILQIKISQLVLNTDQYVRTGLDAFDVIEHDGASKLIKALGDAWQNTAEWQDYVALGGLVAVLLGPIYYLLYGIGYVFRALAGKQFKRGIFFNLIYLGASFGILYWISTNNYLNLNFGFFDIANVGFWVSFGAIWVAGFSLLFAKKL